MKIIEKLLHEIFKSKKLDLHLHNLTWTVPVGSVRVNGSVKSPCPNSDDCFFLSFLYIYYGYDTVNVDTWYGKSRCGE